MVITSDKEKNYKKIIQTFELLWQKTMSLWENIHKKRKRIKEVLANVCVKKE